MTQAGVALLLIRRDPARNLALTLAVFSVLLFLVSPPSRAPFWIGLLILPVFLISTALAVPAFSAFELAMPVTRPQLLWSRILASLGLVWLSMLTGVATMLLLNMRLGEQPLTDARQPVEFAVFFTASACLATSARVSPRPKAERLLWLLAVACGLLALRSLPWRAALVLTGVAALPILARLWWTYVPEWDRRCDASVRPVFDEWHAVFQGTPEGVRRQLQEALGIDGIRCVSVPLEELFVELVGNERLMEVS